MSSGLGAFVVLVLSLVASLAAAVLSGATLTTTVWAVLLAEAVVMALLVAQIARRSRQLADQTRLAQFARDSADVLTRQRTPDAVLAEGARLLSGLMGVAVFVLKPQADGQYRTASHAFAGALRAPDFATVPTTEAVRWSARNARPVGPGTDNWPDFTLWYMPFSRLPGEQPVLVVDATAPQPRAVADTLSFLRSFTDLLAASHDRLQSLQRAHDAEIMAERQRLQNRFLASISHDMRTPLTGILGASSTLLEQGDQLDPAEQRHLLEGLHRQVRYLADATDNILSLLRLQQSQGTELVTDWESPEEILGLVLARFPQATASGRLQANAEHVDLLLKVNVTLIVQALVNLVDNALRLNDSFEPVCLHLCGAGDWVEYRVSDRGSGFPEGFDINQMMRPLRSDQGREPSAPETTGGSGLGLSIVQAIARAHSARLTVGNRSGGGAEVMMSLPGTPWVAGRQQKEGEAASEGLAGSAAGLATGGAHA